MTVRNRSSEILASTSVNGIDFIEVDAADPTMQYWAQGACMALEDAVALSQALAAHPDAIHPALAAYQSQRVLRTARVQLESRAIGDHIYHPSGVHAELRNAIMRSKSSDDYVDGMAWLYGGP